MAGIFAIEVAKNASGKMVDFDSGADLAVAPRTVARFQAASRPLDGLLTRWQTQAIALVFYVLASAAGA